MACTTPYDELPYPSRAYPLTHPDNLATLGRLLGLTPRSVESCHVLELGCADGGNLIPMATYLPTSQFVGVDSSALQIDRARQLAKTLRLDNLTWLRADIDTLDTELGSFDYIICHGVFSWVSDHTRRRILEICRRHLSAQGLAYLSFNAYPGWHEAEGLRRMLLYHVDATAPPRDRVAQARAFLGLLASAASARGDTRAAFLASQHRHFESLDPAVRDGYFFYDYLLEHNRPFYFHELVDWVDSADLSVLCNADPRRVFPERRPGPLGELSRGRETGVEQQQYLDFLENRRHRAVLLCRAGENVRHGGDVDVDVICQLFARASAAVEGSGTLVRPDEADRAPSQAEPEVAGRGEQRPEAELALTALRRAYPEALAFEELVEAIVGARHAGGPGDEPTAGGRPRRGLRGRLAAELARLYFEGRLELHSYAPDVAREVPEQPRAHRLTRVLAERRGWVATPWHFTLWLDRHHRRLLPLLDGSRTVAEAIDAFRQLDPEGALALGDPERRVRDAIAALARAGLLATD